MSASKPDAPGPSSLSKGKSVMVERPRGRLHLLDLPLETQKQIIAQASFLDLFDAQILIVSIVGQPQRPFYLSKSVSALPFPRQC